MTVSINWREQITVIIPTYNRARFAQRAQAYYKQNRIFHVIVDAGNRADPYLQSRANGVSSYLYGESNIFQRLIRALTIAKTKYVVSACDDEFMLADGLQAAVSFLDKNKEYVACGGQCVGFEYRQDGKISWLLPYPERRPLEVQRDEAIERALDHCDDYKLLYTYSVTHKKDLLEVMSFLGENELPIYGSAEMLLELLLCLRGKSIILDNVVWIRSFGENTPIRDHSQTSLNTSNHILDVMRDVSRGELKARFEHTLTRALLPFTNEVLLDAKTVAGSILMRIENWHAANSDDSPSLRSKFISTTRYARRKLRSVLFGGVSHKEIARSFNEPTNEKLEIRLEEIIKKVSESHHTA